ncbi:MAG: hypothetical protein ACLQDY_26020 [Streptosporangiaceae bacterium]
MSSWRTCSRRGPGRPSLPADLVGPVLVLRELYDLSGTRPLTP